MSAPVRFGVVTPTFQRTALLRGFLRRVRRQKHREWQLRVVHDGPDPRTRDLVGRAARRDSRVLYEETPDRSNDFGATPRALAVRRFADEGSADYLVFWDDDNLFFRRALADAAQALASAGHPDLLIVPVHRHGVVFPAAQPVEALGVGGVDTANFVVRTEIARAVYPTVMAALRAGGDAYNQDALFFGAVRDAAGPARIRIAGCRPIGIYDGLRVAVRLTYLRRSLHIPELNLSRFAWYRGLTRDA